MNISKRKIMPYSAALILMLSVLINAAFAGGPIALFNKTPIVYPSAGANITLNYDQGSLGSRSNATADALVNQSIAFWNDVSTATVNMTQGSDIPADVTASNYTTYDGKYSDGINPIIYDTDGSIIDTFLGAGLKIVCWGSRDRLILQVVLMPVSTPKVVRSSMVIFQ